MSDESFKIEKKNRTIKAICEDARLLIWIRTNF